MSNYEYCADILESLKLKGMKDALDQTAGKDGLSHIDFLKELLDSEISHRTERRMKRNMVERFRCMKVLLERKTLL